MTVTCPSCGTQLRIGDEHAGKTLKCPKCQSQFQAPAAVQQPNAGPLDQLASTTSAPRPAATRKPMTRRVAPRKSKAPAIIGVIALIVVIGIIGAVMSNSGSKNPKYASDEEIIKAAVGEERLDEFRQIKDADYAAYRRSVKLLREDIIMSGLTCEEYAQSRAKDKMIGKKMDEWWETANAEIKAKEAKLRADHRIRADAARRAWKQACEARESIRLTGLSADEYKRQKAKYDAAVATELTTGKTYNQLSGESPEIKRLHDEYNVRAKAYRESLLQSDGAGN